MEKCISCLPMCQKLNKQTKNCFSYYICVWKLKKGNELVMMMFIIWQFIEVFCFCLIHTYCTSYHMPYQSKALSHYQELGGGVVNLVPGFSVNVLFILSSFNDGNTVVRYEVARNKDSLLFLFKRE